MDKNKLYKFSYASIVFSSEDFMMELYIYKWYYDLILDYLILSSYSYLLTSSVCACTR